jgi:hypothetical protein
MRRDRQVRMAGEAMCDDLNGDTSPGASPSLSADIHPNALTNSYIYRHQVTNSISKFTDTPFL